MKAVAVIPARGGSKRIPHKNIKVFAGKPIIAYSIEAALDSELFEKVVVSTDDEEIATVARSFGAEVPFFRPKALSDDHTGTNSVVKHCINWFRDNGEQFDYICCIYATAPFLRPSSLKEGVEKLTANEKSYAFSVTSYPFPIQRALRINSEGCVEALNPEHIFSRSQDLEDAYHDAGQFYWGRAAAFLKDEVVFSPNSVPVVLPRYLVQDIDTQEDWVRAELMYQAWKTSGETMCE
jgi:N-acylneuraminate cytidylyltransferase